MCLSTLRGCMCAVKGRERGRAGWEEARDRRQAGPAAHLPIVICKSSRDSAPLLPPCGVGNHKHWVSPASGYRIAKGQHPDLRERTRALECSQFLPPLCVKTWATRRAHCGRPRLTLRLLAPSVVSHVTSPTVAATATDITHTLNTARFVANGVPRGTAVGVLPHRIQLGGSSCPF